VVPPRDVVRHDGDDPYLVVAADKGTATFSDIANADLRERGFWLADAFASGGSAGYDHKKMGITARGAWEAVKRHFREMDIDIQTTPFTVMGVGDMSGDVFGNGMLLSTADPAGRGLRPPRHLHRSRSRSGGELRRAGGCSRCRDRAGRTTTNQPDQQGRRRVLAPAQGHPLSREMQALTGLTGKTATPGELMSAMLKARRRT
jgi:glutamate dehydrogenase